MQPVSLAVWSTARINRFPDSSFLWIGPGGKKDEEGKTVPRTLRKFPVRDENGKLDLPHLRNAIARIPQSDIPAADKKRLQARARRMLDEAQDKADKRLRAAVAKAAAARRVLLS